MNRVSVHTLATAGAAFFGVCGALGPAYAQTRAPEEPRLERFDFARHVAPLFGRLGCNAGSCHGAFEGKGGFALSLFGFDPAADYLAITRAADGRRVNRLNPAASLLLRKPAMAVAHGGGPRLKRGSWEYGVIERWIAEGAADSKQSSEIVHVRLEPSRLLLTEDDPARALRVIVEFSDGTADDLTLFCEFRSQDDSVASVTPEGVVRAAGAGDTAVIATYRGQPAAARVLVPHEAGDGSSDWPSPPPNNIIDRHIFAKLAELRIQPASLSTDEEFLRRVTLATIGQLPAPDEIRRFTEDDRPEKRLRAIERLLQHPLHAAVWATRFCEITGASREATGADATLQPRRAKMWHDWFRQRFAANAPYDEIVRGVLCGTSREDRSSRDWIAAETALTGQLHDGFQTDYADRETLDLFWQQTSVNEEIPVEDLAERVAAAFLGLRLECARCHKHPFDRWTRSDYAAFAGIFRQVRFGMSPEVRAELTRLLGERREASRHSEEPLPPIPRLQEVYLASPTNHTLDANSVDVLEPRPPGGPPLLTAGDRREALADWLTRLENPYFAANFVNRVWAFYFGVGLVEPVDAFSAANPPSHPELLDALARRFVESGYDIRRLEELILTSRAWQLSAEINATNRSDRRNFARSYVRVLPAEVVVDMLGCCIGDVLVAGTQVPPGIRAVEIAPSDAGDERLDEFFKLFNRAGRQTTCDCERPKQATLRQTMFLLSDPQLTTRIREGGLPRLLECERSDAEIVNELFLSTLSRMPSPDEEAAALDHVARSADRLAAFADVLWGLINTREFITNH